jgi:hypothetical protein
MICAAFPAFEPCGAVRLAEAAHAAMSTTSMAGWAGRRFAGPFASMLCTVYPIGCQPQGASGRIGSMSRALVTLLFACSQPAATTAPPTMPVARPVAVHATRSLAAIFEAVRAQPSGPLIERDGTRWIVQMGSGSAEADHESQPYILFRQPPGSPAAEAARVDRIGWIQTNPTMSGGTDWVFYVNSDGAFRALLQTTQTSGIGDSATTTRTYAGFRFDGNQLVPVDDAQL